MTDRERDRSDDAVPDGALLPVEAETPARKPYEAPAWEVEETFEKSALQCNKMSGQGAFCDLATVS